MSLSGHSCRKSRQTLFAGEIPLIGVIGGSGLCKLPGLEITETIETETPYGKPSGPIIVGELCSGRIAFLPRHGKEHTIPPHKVPYKANIAALKSLGVQHVIGTCVVGSLRKEIEPGTFVVLDQFINLTWGRDDTYEVDRELIHLPMAQPYCEHIREIVARELQAMGVPCHNKGTVVIIQGPRFSTIAESKMFALWGGDVVNMTQYPECYFTRELGLCYGAVASVTDYDVGVPSAVSMQPESMDKVLAVFHRNTEITVLLLGKLAALSREIVGCNCAAHRLAEYYKMANSESP
jgi:5'-methylthioadenosine phosphorylase